MISHSFGVGDEKFVMIYKEETQPDPDQLNHLKLKFNPDFVVIKEPMNNNDGENNDGKFEEIPQSKSRKKQPLRKKNIQKKEEKPDENFEFIKLNVNKRDRRTVDQIQMELAAEKKQKLMKNSSISSSPPLLVNSLNNNDNNGEINK